MNKAQHTTRYIKHLAESANFKGSTFNKLCNGLIGNRFEMPNVSYTHPLSTSKKEHSAKMSIKYPMINITDKNWDKEDDLTVFMLFDEFIYTKRMDLFKQYYKDKEFCDCQGNVYKVIDRRLPVSFWRNFFRFLPNVYKVELRFIQENRKMTLDNLKTFMLERLDEINTNDFVPEWIDSVKKANSYKELLDSEIK